MEGVNRSIASECKMLFEQISQRHCLKDYDVLSQNGPLQLNQVEKFGLMKLEPKSSAWFREEIARLLSRANTFETPQNHLASAVM